MPKFESFSSSSSERQKKKKSKSRGQGLSGSGAGSLLDGLIGLATLGVVSPPSEKRKKRK